MQSTSPVPAPDSPVTLSIRSAEDLIAIVPVMMTFHPKRSVVLIATEGDRQFGARADLPGGAGPDAEAELVERLLLPARRHGLRAIALLFFSEDGAVVRGVWRALRRAAAAARIDVWEALWVGKARYYPLLGPARLREIGIPYDVSAHPFVAEGVLHGEVVHQDRDALAASVRPIEAQQRAVEAALDRLGLARRDPPSTGADRRARGEWVRALVEEHVGARSRATDDEVATAAWAVQDLRVRDAAWALIDRASARAHQEFWLDVARRVPERLVAAPSTLFAWASWRDGRGALASIGVERCWEVAPDYGLADLLAEILERALPPDAFELPVSWDEGLPA